MVAMRVVQKVAAQLVYMRDVAALCLAFIKSEMLTR